MYKAGALAVLINHQFLIEILEICCPKITVNNVRDKIRLDCLFFAQTKVYNCLNIYLIIRSNKYLFYFF